MISQLLAVIGQSLIFILGVYLQKYLRKRFFSREQGKRIKQNTRILTCTIVTAVILYFNHQSTCMPQGLSYSDCLYLKVNFYEIIHVLLANSILFGLHIYEKFIKSKADFSHYSIKSVFFAPLLEEMLFRASYFRTSSHEIPTWILALIFSLSHLHRPIRKFFKAKNPDKRRTISQVIFTFIFGCYSFYFLSTWQSIIPSIILHCYCNLLGPPSITNQNKYYHLCCIGGMLLYNYLFI